MLKNACPARGRMFQEQLVKFGAYDVPGVVICTKCDEVCICVWIRCVVSITFVYTSPETGLAYMRGQVGT